MGIAGNEFTQFFNLIGRPEHTPTLPCECGLRFCAITPLNEQLTFKWIQLFKNDALCEGFQQFTAERNGDNLPVHQH